LQDFIANTVKQIQGELSQFRQEFHDEGTRIDIFINIVSYLKLVVKTERSRLKPSTVYGDQHRLCLEGTRNKTRVAIHSWIADQSNTHKIYYLLDVPGSGKSTVSKQLFAELDSKGQLVARFFFSRDTEETMSINSFCSAVSDAFADRNEKFKDHVEEFKKLPRFKELTFEEKLKGLVMGPLELLEIPAVLIVDAVDECNNDYKGRDQLLDALHVYHSSAPLLRIFITGRPEIDIKKRAEKSVGFHTFRELEGVNKDVERYIHSRLHDELSEDQRFPEDQRDVVIHGADGLFIWARTACDLLVDAVDREDLLKTLGGEVSLTDLYKIAMKQAMPKDAASRRAILTVLGMILAAKRPLTIDELKLLSPKPTAIESAVGRLGSFLVCDDPEEPIRLVHITFRDFITDQSKAGQYFVQVKLGHYALALQTIAIIGNTTMQKNLKDNKLGEKDQEQVIKLSMT
jgi:hypothetical protein